MSFALSMRNVPRVTSYADAVRFYERCVPWRNGGKDRPLINKRTRDMGVRMNGDDVVFRYHRTDVIRWKPDDSYEIDTGGYSSRSTCDFATNFMPHYHSLFSEARYLRINDYVYAVFGSRLSVSAESTVSGDGLGRFEHQTINRKRARGMLKEMGYYPYLDWHKVMYPMVQDTMPPVWNRPYMDVDEKIGALALGVDAYYQIMMSAGGEPDAVRDLLYTARGTAYNIWDKTYHDTLPSSANLRRYNIVVKG